MRIGIGWDRHRLVEGRPCILGGIRFDDCPVGPLGHSDGDAVAHAVIDAILGAAALGDIGHYFPDDDPTWAGADSLDLLRGAAAMVRDEGWRVVNVDVTVVTERPRIAPRAVRMGEILADALGAPDAVCVKATRGEGLGPEGRGECVTVMAAALLAPAEEEGS